jgi:hypothetical protein
MNYIQELQDVIWRLHGVEASHVESIPVKEAFQSDCSLWSVTASLEIQTTLSKAGILEAGDLTASTRVQGCKTESPQRSASASGSREDWT